MAAYAAKLFPEEYSPKCTSMVVKLLGHRPGGQVVRAFNCIHNFTPALLMIQSSMIALVV